MQPGLGQQAATGRLPAPRRKKPGSRVKKLAAQYYNIAAQHNAFFPERYRAMSLTYSQARSIGENNSMNILPVDRALSIYSALANRCEAKGARERLSRHMMKMYIDGEKDEHRLTVDGLSYLRDLHREIDSRN
jgi:hypothetical protein